MMDSLKRHLGCGFSPVIISSLVGRWRICIHDATSRLPSRQKASARVEIHLKSTRVCHLDAARRKQRQFVICAHRCALWISVGVKKEKLNTASPQALQPSVRGSSSQTEGRVVCWKTSLWRFKWIASPTAKKSIFAFFDHKSLFVFCCLSSF